MKKYGLSYFLFLCVYHTATLGNTLYDLLGVSNDCSQEDLNAGYRRMAGAFHPDRNKSSGAGERFKEVKEAYKTLSSPALRNRYDTVLKSPGYQNGFGNGQKTQEPKRHGISDDETTATDNNNSETEQKGDNHLHTAIRRERGLMESADQQEQKIIDMLEIVMEGADVNAKNSQEETPLALAIKKELPAVSLFLMNNGARPEIPDGDGNNSLHRLLLYMHDYYHSSQRYSHLRGNDRKTVILAQAMITRAHGTNLLIARNNKGELPLELAIDYDINPIAVLIINRSGVETLNEEERSRLVKKAIQKQQMQIVQLLLKRNVTEESNPSRKKRSLNFFEDLCENFFKNQKTVEQ